MKLNFKYQAQSETCFRKGHRGCCARNSWSKEQATVWEMSGKLWERLAAQLDGEGGSWGKTLSTGVVGGISIRLGLRHELSLRMRCSKFSALSLTLTCSLVRTVVLFPDRRSEVMCEVVRQRLPKYLVSLYPC